MTEVFFNALTGTYPLFEIDYSKVVVSEGKLLTVPYPEATAETGGIVKFSWSDNSGIPNANGTDQCVMVVYCPELNRAVYSIDGATRDIGNSSINAGIFKDKIVETWISFVTADKDVYASSIYTGQLMIV